MSDWQPTACILCECNCGIEVRLGGDDGRRFERIRGDKAHPCLARLHVREGAAARPLPERAPPADVPDAPPRRRHVRGDRLGHGDHRDRRPLRRRARHPRRGVDLLLRRRRSGEPPRRLRTRRRPRGALGSRFRSSALAQEKTGEFWVNAKMLGTHVRGDFEHTEVAVFFGKNPWQSHGLPHARTTLKEIARDPARSLIVVDPRRTETAELADIHLQVRPGTDAWCLAAICAVLVQEDLVASAWLAEHATGLDEVAAVLRQIDVGQFAAVAGVDEHARASGRPAHRRRVERRRLRGPRRADVAALDARQLPRQARSGCSPATSPSRAGSTCRRASSTSPARA